MFYHKHRSLEREAGGITRIPPDTVLHSDVLHYLTVDKTYNSSTVDFLTLMSRSFMIFYAVALIMLAVNNLVVVLIHVKQNIQLIQSSGFCF